MPNWRDMTKFTPGSVTLAQALGLPPAQNMDLEATLPVEVGQAEAAAAQASASTSSSGSAGSGGNATAPASASESDWIKAFLSSLGAPQTTANINSMSAWIRHEAPWNASPPDGALYTNNPMNTTLSLPGATSINSVGVKKYPTAAIGIQALVQTLHGGYPGIVAALKSGKGLCGAAPSEFSKWSGGGYSGIC